MCKQKGKVEGGRSETLNIPQWRPEKVGMKKVKTEKKVLAGATSE